MNQQVARELLKAEGAEVELADNGLVAVTMLAQLRDTAPFDAVLMDVQMPVMDGFTATRAIRKDLGLAQLPIIAMTANAMASDREDCLEAGMTDHVGKPFDLNYLVQVLLKTSGFVPAAPAAEQELVVTIDVETALAQIDGMKDLYVDLIQQFVKELESVTADYQRALNAMQMADATRLMHTLKGTAATLGVTPLSQLALSLEHVCKASAQPADALARTPELAAMVNASITALNLVSQKISAELASAKHYP